MKSISELYEAFVELKHINKDKEFIAGKDVKIDYKSLPKHAQKFFDALYSGFEQLGNKITFEANESKLNLNNASYNLVRVSKPGSDYGTILTREEVLEHNAKKVVHLTSGFYIHSASNDKPIYITLFLNMGPKGDASFKLSFNMDSTKDLKYAPGMDGLKLATSVVKAMISKNKAYQNSFFNM
ncbi:gp199 [Sphingomonas phage PAU]|uniref:gp199 n=1 Tax=Sphingomonas phage PAU TaxID=1150991 RepID=UPI0002573365|nr:gp199 [Sphingomonas phage PAU]AFF28197.1 gp199 [Sphingomonas phage PAU]